MEERKGRHVWMVKIGEKGQFVIPKEARELFGLHPGCEIMVLGDEARGIAILPMEQQKQLLSGVFPEQEEG